MHQENYRMAVIITPDSEDDPEWPGKHKWFDASEWLRMPQYVKINDYYLLNTQYAPVDNVHDIGITRRIQDAVKRSIHSEPELRPLGEMEPGEFSRLVRNSLSCEYLRTSFNHETLRPTEDFFLFSFTYNNQTYEVELLREKYKGGFIFMNYGRPVHKAGYWHGVSPAGYSWRDRLAGKAPDDAAGGVR
ncbi:hypothetical protein GJV78_08290 [Escherichia alba]|jgi:hypothetical protein|uniref:Uncharacterized protein n=2 Tax=Intestinirhabdus alba TaxID=2899544 RepID=A0A6L6IKK9_9ENTR|nr:hypothetical protein [Intestinirhabdus alba]